MTLSHTLQSSPVHQIKIKINGLNLSSVFISLQSLSLISISYLSLLVSDTDPTLNSQVSNVFTFSLSLSLSFSISDKYSNQKPEISSPNPLVSHKRSLSLTL